ncbi:MAG: hypothetical protein JWO55_651 [Candidatus Saccharibacteria bacterium]|jgi:hypothetical protein|nr:hypothetical protein [Candidatus Saccharibacteria bacterium]
MHNRPTPPGDYFPYTDIPTDVTSVIKPLLKDGTAVAECHKNLDTIYPLYKFGHAALELLTLDLGVDDQKRISFLHGVTLYEVTASIVRPWAPRYSLPTTEKHLAHVKNLRDTPELIPYEFADAYSSLLEAQENTAKLIADSIRHDTFFDQGYTLQGAAMARSLETSIIEDATTA